MQNILKAIVLCSLVFGCSSRPPEVHATRPLVDENQVDGGHNIVDTRQIEFFENAQYGSSITVNGAEYVVLNSYVSALGGQCVQYALVDSSQLNREIACKHDRQWKRYTWQSSGFTVIGGGDTQ